MDYILKYMSSTVSIPLSKSEKVRLSRLALSYGLSLPELSRRVLEQLAAEIPEESFEDYLNPKELRASFNRALHDWQAGRVRARL